MNRLFPIAAFLIIISCSTETKIKPDYFLSADQKHSKWSSAIKPVLTVPSGSVIQAETNEASDGQLDKDATLDDLINLDFGPIHPLTGPVYVEAVSYTHLTLPTKRIV